jgi:hypothetical protein
MVLVLGDRGMELAYEENGERGSRSHGIRQELKGVELAADELECVVVDPGLDGVRILASVMS